MLWARRQRILLFVQFFDEKAFDKITELIEVGNKEAIHIHGGNSKKDTGYFIEPTIFIDADPQSTVMQEEILGPVLSISKVADFEQGIEV